MQSLRVGEKPLYYFLPICLLPLILGIAGAGLRYLNFEQAISRAELSAEGLSEIREGVRQECLLTIGVGVFGTAIPILIGAMGLMLKRKKDG